jgi:hypothetical protein
MLQKREQRGKKKLIYALSDASHRDGITVFFLTTTNHHTFSNPVSEYHPKIILLYRYFRIRYLSLTLCFHIFTIPLLLPSFA